MWKQKLTDLAKYKAEYALKKPATRALKQASCTQSYIGLSKLKRPPLLLLTTPFLFIKFLTRAQYMLSQAVVNEK